MRYENLHEFYGILDSIKFNFGRAARQCHAALPKFCSNYIIFVPWNSPDLLHPNHHMKPSEVLAECGMRDSLSLWDRVANTALCAEVKHGYVWRTAPHITVSVLNAIAQCYKQLHKIIVLGNTLLGCSPEQ
jgi:hypothetical protein